MMGLREIQFEDDRWDQIVESIEDYYVHYKRAYVTAFANLNHNEPVLFYYQDGDERAIQVFFKRDIAEMHILREKISKGRYYDLISPYGYGGYVGKVFDFNKVEKAHTEYCREQGYVCEVVKFHPLSEYIHAYNGILTTKFHNVVRKLDDDLETIWMDLKSKVRRNVKRARECNLQFLIQDGQRLDDFLEIYYKTMVRTNADREYFFDRDFFCSINEMRNNSAYFYVLTEEKVISAELVLYDNLCSYFYLGGTDSDYFDMRPNDFLKFEIIKWAKSKGLRYYILGGGHGEDDGIFQYKSALAPLGVVDFYVGTDIFDKVKYDELCAIRKIIDPSFHESEKMIPAYRF